MFIAKTCFEQKFGQKIRSYNCPKSPVSNEATELEYLRIIGDAIDIVVL